MRSPPVPRPRVSPPTSSRVRAHAPPRSARCGHHARSSCRAGWSFHQLDHAVQLVEYCPQPTAKENAMDTVGLLVMLEAKPGKEDELASFLAGALPLVQEEPQTTAWFAVRIAPTQFAIFDTFPDDAGRDAHLSGQVAAALMEHAPDLLSQAPDIQKVDVVAEKL